MHSNGKHVVPAAILVLILCVLCTNQTLTGMFFRKKAAAAATTIPPQLDDDYFGQQTGRVSQKEHHWWQTKHQPAAASSEAPAQNKPNQVAVAVPLINQKLQSIIDSHSDVKWVPCLCPIKRPAQKPSHQTKPKPQHHQHQQHHQQQQQHQQQQPPLEQPQKEEEQQQQQEEQQQPASSYTSTTAEPSSYEENVPRFIFAANYPFRK